MPPESEALAFYTHPDSLPDFDHLQGIFDQQVEDLVQRYETLLSFLNYEDKSYTPNGFPPRPDYDGPLLPAVVLDLVPKRNVGLRTLLQRSQIIVPPHIDIKSIATHETTGGIRALWLGTVPVPKGIRPIDIVRNLPDTVRPATLVEGLRFLQLDSSFLNREGGVQRSLDFFGSRAGFHIPYLLGGGSTPELGLRLPSHAEPDVHILVASQATAAGRPF